MEKLLTFYIKAAIICSVVMLEPFISPAVAQGNCLLYPEGSGERHACELSYQAIEYEQGSRLSQQLFDSAIQVGPNYAWSYYEKAVPFFKHGMLHEGVNLLNVAIGLEPRSFYLTYRAYWYFMNQSLDHCVEDLHRYYDELNGPLEFTPGGEMEMRLVLGIAHAQKGNLHEGIKVISDYISDPHWESRALYDNYVLGVLYFNDRRFDLAKDAFLSQVKSNEYFGNAHYYLGLLYLKTGDKSNAKKEFNLALNKFGISAGGFELRGYDKNSTTTLGLVVTKQQVKDELQKLM